MMMTNCVRALAAYACVHSITFNFVDDLFIYLLLKTPIHTRARIDHRIY